MHNKEFALNLTEIIKKLGLMKRIPRYGWLVAGVAPSDVESISEHTLRVTQISMLVADILSAAGTVIDKVKLLKMALLHDVPEIELQDLTPSATEMLGITNKNELELNALQKLFSKLSEKVISEYIAILNEYLKRETIEAKIVYCVDKLEMLFQAYEYESIKYKKAIFNNFWDSAKALLTNCEIQIIRDIFNLLQDQRGN